MEGRLESAHLGPRGFYRFTNPEWEQQYQARLRRWCFWMAIFHLYFDLALDLIGIIGWLYGGASDLPTAFWCTVAVDAVVLLFLFGLHTSPRCRRYIIPIHCTFIWLVLARNAFLIPLQAIEWTDSSYDYLVPASDTVFVSGPTGQKDIGVLLHDHLGSLSAYRSMQIAYANSYAPGIYNMLMGFNPWTLATAVGLNVLLTTGLVLTPFVQVPTMVLNPCVVVALTTLGVLFAAAFERMQRRHFEAERLLQWELQASQMADSVLNHSLKNTLADVAGNIEMFLAGVMPSKALEDCILSLRRGIRSCKERQGYLQLAAGQYQPVLNAIPLQDFGRQLLAGRDVVGRFPDCTIYADHMLLTLILDNALSNAAKHGHPQLPDVTFSIEEAPAEHCAGVPEGKRRFRFQVTNVAHPRRAPLTPEYVEELFTGCAEPQKDCVVPTLSDRIGLSHCVLAARLGGIALSLSQEEDLVTFCATVDAELVPAVHRRDSLQDENGAARPPPFPSGLRFAILDDSLPAQKLLQFHIEKLCHPAAVVCLGATSDDVQPFMAAALEADIIIIDQHLDWPENSCLGTDLVRQLRLALFRGFICVRSANDGPQDQAVYLRSGADCSVGKDLLGPVMLRQLRLAYAQFLCRGPPAPPPVLDCPSRRDSDVPLNGLSYKVATDPASSSSLRESDPRSTTCTDSLSPLLTTHDLQFTSMDRLLANVPPEAEASSPPLPCGVVALPPRSSPYQVSAPVS
eukprot:EG_transcript_4388